MPYICVQSDDLNGTTIIGDSQCDVKFMQTLGAVFDEALRGFITRHSARLVLDKLEKKGFVVVACSESHDRITWTLHKVWTDKE